MEITIKSREMFPKEERKTVKSTNPLHSLVDNYSKALNTAEEQIEEQASQIQNELLPLQEKMKKIDAICPDDIEADTYITVLRTQVDKAQQEKSNFKQNAENVSQNITTLSEAISLEKKELLERMEEVGHNNPFVLKDQLISLVKNSFVMKTNGKESE